MTTSPATASATATVRPRRRRVRRQWPGRLLTVLGLLLGIVITLFPVAGTFYNNWHAYDFAQRQAKQTLTDPSGHVDNGAALAAAHRYNATLNDNLLSDPWNGTDPESTPAYKQYEKQLGGASGVMGTLRLPTIKTELPLLHGTSEWTLDRGAGHMYGTSLPVGGPGTHAALAAHRGLPQLTGFDHLPDLKIGDQFFIDVAGQTLAYQVKREDTVLPTDLKLLHRVKGQDLVTLITCTPYGINSHRLLVTASRIPWSQVDPKQAQWHGFDWTIQSWMWVRIGIALATLAILLWMIIGWIRDDRRRARRLAAKRAAALAAAEGAPS